MATLNILKAKILMQSRSFTKTLLTQDLKKTHLKHFFAPTAPFIDFILRFQISEFHFDITIERENIFFKLFNNEQELGGDFN